MKKILLLLTLLATMMSLPAQDKVTVKFTAKDQNGKYCPFTGVEVTNVTRNWTATLLYPDTVLTLTPTGVGEYGTVACRLGNAFPNPFSGETRVPLELAEAAEVQLRVVRIDGTEVAARVLHLDAGTHHVCVRLSSPGLSLLMVTSPKGSQVAKLVSEGSFGRNAIEVKAVASRDAKSGSYDATGDFVLGDMMKYVGKTTFESAPVSSAAVTQAQSADATVVLEFPVTIPDAPVTPTWPDGILPGKFSVSATQQVQFSQGNLQYTKSTGVWSFMEHQYDMVGTNGQDVGENYANQDVISFFGWGTSGWDNGNTYYQPWNTNNTNSFLYGPNGSYDLTGSYANADWGVYNPISNGGNVAGMWRTLTKDEWVYVFNTRSTVSGIRFAKAIVNDVNGVIILPDDWSGSYYSLNNANLGVAAYDSNNISLSDWETSLEAHGAVFLPAAGIRNGVSFYYVGSYGFYWSASYSETGAYRVYFYDSHLSPQSYPRYGGQSVRLVRSAPSAPTATVPTVTTADVADIAETTATAGGEVTDDGGATVIECGVCWSTSADPTTAGNHLAASTGGTGSFTVNIAGLIANTTYHVRAYATNGEGTAYGEDKTFTTLSEIPVTPTWPDGTLPGKFSVSATQQVQFSQGNLQYIGSAATPYWKFADRQWDYFGVTTGQNSDAQNVDRDLFGWGTSGYNHGAVCYQPWSTSETYSDYYAYGNSTYNLNDQTGQADWGYNAILNGGNVTGMWRTLTKDEWVYVFNTRSTANGIRFAKAQVNDVNGVIILPDDWSSSYYSLNNANLSDADFSSNMISLSDWETSLEAHDAVFLPAAGLRYGTSVYCVGSFGYYWSASYGSENGAYYVYFNGSNLSPQNYDSRNYGQSVRLVRSAPSAPTATIPTVTTADVTDIAETSATAGGEVTDNGGANVAERGVCWSTDADPTISDNHLAASLLGTSSFTVNISSLTANTTYHVRAYATNSEGTGYGEDKTFTTLSEIPVTPTWPDGTLPGYFSVSAGQQVQFSQGNLQYTKSTGEWSFMDHQYDIVIDGVEDVGEDYANYDVITLFGWGTSGCNIGNTYYQPWNTDNSSNDLYGPVGEYNLTGTYANADWGVWNPISNGGNVAGMWRTLTKDEWVYVFNTRSTASGIRYAKATVNDIEGMVLLPDDWSNSYYSLNDANLGDAVCESNIISLSDWTNALEAHGAVFLPIAGDRDGTFFSSYGSGNYWSASCYNENIAYDVRFWGSYFNPEFQDNRYAGNSVRLVRFEPTVPTVTTADVTDITKTTATAGGELIDNGGASIIERGVCWSTSADPTTADDHSTASPFGASAFTVNITSLTANTTYHVRAYATNSEGTAYGEDKTFTTLPEVLVAPIGAIDALFSIGADNQVYFSKGNLQYIGSAATPYWKFAENQWDYLGDNGQGSTIQNVDRDLFGWGTSGYHDSSDPYNVNYQPWSTSMVPLNPTYNNYGYGPSSNMASLDLTGASADYDWGVYNPISNGANMTGLWFTMSKEEWEYLIETRAASSVNGVANARFAKAKINGVKGLIVFPDNYTHPSGVAQPTDINQNDVGWNGNDYSIADWMSMELAGCVFLPNAGYRQGTTVTRPGEYGTYWSVTHSGNDCAFSIDFYQGALALIEAGRPYGTSVRLVSHGVTSNAPTGAIDSKFTINSSNDKVYFSQGNLQYIGSASTPYWKFADSQLDYLGQNGQSSSDPNIDRDLFGFGTSGYNHGAVCYQPWSTSYTYSDYYVYGDYTYNLFDQTGQADWGYNAISNGGNAENLWRTLTREEWNYVFNERSTSSGLRYAKATIGEVKGIILFPDDWNSAVLNPTNANSADANFETQLTVADWTSIYEPQGAVFLPAAGYRDGNVMLGYGFYQSSSSGGQYNSCNVFFDSWRCTPSGTNRRERGFSVRLVYPVH